LVVLYPTDLTDVLKSIETAGGDIVKPIFDFLGGRRLHFTDLDCYKIAV